MLRHWGIMGGAAALALSAQAVAGIVPINQVQGEGDISPYVDQQVEVQGIVVADFQEGNQLKGFFLQEQRADNNPATSEGIFVHTGTDFFDVQEGEKVTVSGTVKEFNGLTELVNVYITRNGWARLPKASVIRLPLNAKSDLESYEGMRVKFRQKLEVSDTYGLGRYGQLWLASERLYTPTSLVAPGAEANAVQARNDLHRILLDDGSSTQNPKVTPFPYWGLSAQYSLRVGDHAYGVEGVMHYAYGNYVVHATRNPYFVSANYRTEAPYHVRGSVRIASANVLNYFNGDGHGAGFPTERGADSFEEFQRQRAKTISAIQAMDSDIVGLMEVENDGFDSSSAIADLVSGLNAASAEATYAFINPGVEQIGTDHISVGLIYRADTMEPAGPAAILDSTVDPRFNDDKNRPSLAQTFVEKATGKTVTVVVNHLKSKGSSCEALGDPNTNDGQGNCNITRTRAAEAVADWANNNPTGTVSENVLLIGDMNAYAKEDPITAMKQAGFRDMVAEKVGEYAYSYVFRGQSGYLDHALANEALAWKINNVVEWHINADEPRLLDYNTEYKTEAQKQGLYAPDAYRASDHDPVVIGLDL